MSEAFIMMCENEFLFDYTKELMKKMFLKTFRKTAIVLKLMIE
jgi:hypothetical protein